jgi:hypothetical protein
MNKLSILTIILTAVLVISVIGNIALISNQNTPTSSDTAKVDMVTHLTAIQVQTDIELQRIANSLIYASKQLSNTGLTGAQANNILSALAANSSYIIDAGTQNRNNIMVAVEPSKYNGTIGKDIGDQEWLNTNPNGEITPVSTPVIPLIENMMGIAMAVPVFDNNKEMIGTVSVIFDPAELLNDTVTSAIAGTSYTTTVMQLDGLMIYDTDPLQLDKNMFTDPTYANYTQLLLFGYHVVQYSSGYGTYKFTVDAASPIVVNKECYWTTVSAYGQVWRIALQHALES